MNRLFRRLKSEQKNVSFRGNTISAISCQSGTDVMIFEIFSPKNLSKKLAFFTQNKAKF
jgi:hypothetical protein